MISKLDNQVDLVSSEIDELKPSIVGLLQFLPEDYPGGDLWLQRRLSEVKADKAFCVVAKDLNEVCGIAICSPKGARLKLSTLYVSPAHRGAGLGRKLIDRVQQVARANGFNETYITLGDTKQEELAPLLSQAGFVLAGAHVGRYGVGRTELCYKALNCTS